MQSIGDFAANLINQEMGSIKEGKQLPPNAPDNGLAPAGKDISNVQVPDSFMKEILGESFHPQESPAAESMPELVWEGDDEEIQQPLTEETAQQLVPLLEEVRDLLKEMSAAATTTGQIGTNMAGPQKNDTSVEKIEKSYGYIKSTPSTLPGTEARTKKAVLKASIRNKLSKR